MARMEAKINSYRVLVAKPEGKDHFVVGRIILKFISERNIY